MGKKKEKYSIATVNEFLGNTKDEDEKDFVHFLLKTGFRDDEVAHVDFAGSEIDVLVLNVSVKPEYNWEPKNGKPREEDMITSSLKRFRCLWDERTSETALLSGDT